MKKILLTSLFMAVATIGAQAQKLGFINKDGVVADGSTVVCPAEDDPFHGKMCATGSLALNNYTSEDITCTVTVNLIDNTIGVMPQICMGGSCSQITSWPFTRTFTCPASKQVLAQYDVDPENYGELNSKMTVTGGGETHTIYIKFVNTDPAGIDNVVASESKCTVYDVQGNVIADNVEANAVTSLRKGLYIVRSVNSKQIRKVVVR